MTDAPAPADRPHREPDPARAGFRADAVPEVEDPGEILPAQGGALGAESQGPLREIARAFQMNAEALQSLKQMQVDLTATVQRGDRSELVLQSTKALNETFRNLSGVQRELLTRLDRRGGGGRGPLIPLMLLGLLAVVVVGVYVILDEVQQSARRKPALDPVEVAQRQQDSWKEGRREGATQAERELRRLQEALEAAQGRTRKLEQDLDAKLGALGELERNKRLAELERDEFAGQVRKAQNEILAKQVLEDEVGSLRSQVSNATREVDELRVDLDRQRRTNRDYRQRLADYGMDIPEDDRPYRPPERATTDPAVGAGDGPAEDRPTKPKFVNLVGAGRDDRLPPSEPASSPPRARQARRPSRRRSSVGEAA